MEEAGYGANSVQVLRSLTLAPTYMSHQTHLVLARDLYPKRLPGDEPAELAVVPWKLDALHELILREDRSEEHTSELQSLMRNSYAVFCLTKKRKHFKHQSTP